MISKILEFFGYTETWHISWTAMISGRDISYGDGIYNIPGGMMASKITELREFFANEISKEMPKDADDVTSKQINIISMTRIKST